jgi:hypothetical protein
MMMDGDYDDEKKKALEEKDEAYAEDDAHNTERASPISRLFYEVREVILSVRRVLRALASSSSGHTLKFVGFLGITATNALAQNYVPRLTNLERTGVELQPGLPQAASRVVTPVRD